MPFKKKGKYYYSPSGRRYTAKQVRLYYATNGFKKLRLKVLMYQNLQKDNKIQ